MFNIDVAWNYDMELPLQYYQLNKSQIKFLFVYNLCRGEQNKNTKKTK